MKMKEIVFNFFLKFFNEVFYNFFVVFFVSMLGFLLLLEDIIMMEEF